jgi:predicted dehydrogenase
VLKAVCARNKDTARAFAAKWGFESFETDWRKLVERADIDMIDIASPNDTHAEIAIAAAKAGKMILCEKPLSMNGPEGKTMVRPSKRPRCRTWSGTITAASPPSRWPSN